MKKTSLSLFALALALPVFAATTVTDLRCESLVNPSGIDVATPRLSWMLKSDRRGEQQTAYQVLVATSQEALPA